MHVGDDRYLYYTGWNVLASRRWDGKPAFANTIGLAISRGGGLFVRHSDGPILGRSHTDPFSMSYPWVEPPRDRHSVSTTQSYPTVTERLNLTLNAERR